MSLYCKVECSYQVVDTSRLLNNYFLHIKVENLHTKLGFELWTAVDKIKKLVINTIQNWGLPKRMLKGDVDDWVKNIKIISTAYMGLSDKSSSQGRPRILYCSSQYDGSYKFCYSDANPTCSFEVKDIERFGSALDRLKKFLETLTEEAIPEEAIPEEAIPEEEFSITNPAKAKQDLLQKYMYVILIVLLIIFAIAVLFSCIFFSCI